MGAELRPAHPPAGPVAEALALPWGGRRGEAPTMTAQFLFLLLTCLSLMALRAAPPAAVQLQRLRCELLTNPEGNDGPGPILYQPAFYPVAVQAK